MNRKALFLIICLVLFNLAFVSVTLAGLDLFRSRPYGEFPSSSNGWGTAVFQYPARQPVSSGGGEWVVPNDHLLPEQRLQLETALALNIEQLQKEGILPASYAPATVPFIWPVQPASYLNDFGYHGISGFVDHNASYPYQWRDYACGERTYDTPSGYNHPGTDIFSWPFPWSRMDNNEIMVVAAAPGVIVLREDGNYDRNCSFTGMPWNIIVIQHSDGSQAWYAHMKNGSLTPKQVGQSVAASEYLGIVGSSGNSTGPHLHFEVHAANGQILDPFAGVCNATTPTTLWAQQPAYYDTAVNKITTGYAAPIITECSTPEQSFEANSFNPGDDVYFTTYYRDQLASQPSYYTIYRPDGAIYQSWQHSISDTHYSASWWWWAFEIPTSIPQGYWEFTVTVNGQTYSHTFLVGPPPPTATPSPTPQPTPLPTPAVITVTAPNGGEVITPGAILSVTWQTVLTPPLQVDLWHNAQLSRTLGVADNGRITWTIPISTHTAIYNIRVSNTLSPTQYDESDNSFIIGILDHHHYLPLIRKPVP